MKQIFETQSFVQPKDVQADIAHRFKEKKGIRSVELQLKGEALENSQEFSRMLLALKKRGVKISYEFSIRLDFPRDISRELVLRLLDHMPTSKNGSVRARIEHNPTRKKLPGDSV